MSKLIIPELNGRAIAERYYAVVKPDKKYTADKAWWQFRQDAHLQQNVIKHIVKQIHDKQQQIIAKYFADLEKGK